MNVFDEVMHRLSSKTRMRGLFKDVHVEDLERIVSRLSDVLDEKKKSVLEEKEKVESQTNQY